MNNIIKKRGIEDLTGKTFGRLTVVQRGPNNKNNRDQWWCKCSCNNEVLSLKLGNSLRMGKAQSCGCTRREKTIKRNKEGRKVNNYSGPFSDEHGQYYVGTTFNTNNQFYVDIIDFDKIKDYCWYEVIDSKRYHYLATVLPDSHKNTKMQWVICGKNIDHADRNALNNRRYNLRKSDAAQQNMNQKIQSNNITGFIGVGFHKLHNKWTAGIGVKGKWIHLGYFNHKEDAIKARLYAELKYFGCDFAPQRHLFKQYNIKEDNKNDI